MPPAIWVFGYGSLLFKQNFPYDKSVPCRIKGLRRVFYQGSTDHRGVPGAPGRVVTLIPVDEKEQEQEQEKGGGEAAAAAAATTTETHNSGIAEHVVPYVCGIAFHIPEEHVDEALSILDFREQGGYSRYDLPAFEIDSDTQLIDSCIAYIANEQNDNYLGPASEHDIAQEIVLRKGPSGTNAEYLFKLAEALRAMGAHDDHVYELERQSKLRLANNDDTANPSLLLHHDSQ